MKKYTTKQDREELNEETKLITIQIEETTRSLSKVFRLLDGPRNFIDFDQLGTWSDELLRGYVL